MEMEYYAYDETADHAGAASMIQNEWDYIANNRKGFDSESISGIAVSGGGLRSSIFFLGVLQALVVRDKLRVFEYLSCVTGGSYICGTLVWLLSGQWRQGSNGKGGEFGVQLDDFPIDIGITDIQKGSPGKVFNPDLLRERASILRYLRQVGTYLTPGKGINELSFVAVALRNVLLGVLSLSIFSGFIFSALYTFEMLIINDMHSTLLQLLLAASFLGFFLLVVFYIVRVGYGSYRFYDPNRNYQARLKYETYIPLYLSNIIALLVLVLIHWFQVQSYDLTGYGPFEFAVASILVGSGFLILLIRYATSESFINDSLKFLPDKFLKFIEFLVKFFGLTNISILAILFGILVISDYLIGILINLLESSLFTTGVVLFVASMLSIVLYRFIPINDFSLFQYYRDRVMEAFLPDVKRVMHGVHPEESMSANVMGLHDQVHPAGKDMPYLLINTAVSLNESNVSKFRERGCDNFVLSTRYCGSNATGWRSSTEFCDGTLSLASSIAISGSRLSNISSVLMSFLNLNKGFWVPNPNPQFQADQSIVPNFLFPGIWATLFRSRINEKSRFVHLSDAASFDNLGIYELVRRKANLIVVCDAGFDPDYQFKDLYRAVEKVKVDFGVRINISPDKLEKIASSNRPEDRFFLTEVVYPFQNESNRRSLMIYLKAQYIEDKFEEFPFEAYREMGSQIATAILDDLLVQDFL